MFSIQHLKKRISNVKTYMADKNIDAAIVFNSLNIYYLTGFPRGRILILSLDEDPILIVPELEFDEADETFKIGKIVSMKTSMNLYELICSELMELKRVSNIAAERQNLTIELYSSLLKKLNVSDLIDFSQCIPHFRSVKDEEELELIKKALRIAEYGIKSVMDNVHEGISEIQLAGEIEYAMRKAGAERYAFESIVASGFRSAYPHGSTTNKTIKNGELVVIDVGAKYGGYCSDITRTMVVGGVSDNTVKKAFNCIVEAMDAAVERLSKGVSGSDVDAAARKIIEGYGYGKYFTHSLGHGVGLAVHEEPGLNSRNVSPLLEGNVVTIEPGIYIRGLYGVRIEDMAVVRSEGCEILNTLDRILI
ncbi:MAG: Xaa-Pro peptidase family protein [Candidatus Methanomethylicia archaeon]